MQARALKSSEVKSKMFLAVKISPKNGLNVNLLSAFQDPIMFGHSNAGGEEEGRGGFVCQLA